MRQDVDFAGKRNTAYYYTVGLRKARCLEKKSVKFDEMLWDGLPNYVEGEKLAGEWDTDERGGMRMLNLWWWNKNICIIVAFK